MQQKSKTNWWVIAAVIIIGVPIGFVIMGVINKSSKHDGKKELEKVEIQSDVSKINEDNAVGSDNAVKIEEVKPAEEKPVNNKGGKSNSVDDKKVTPIQSNDEKIQEVAIQKDVKNETTEDMEKRHQEQDLRRRQEAERQERLAEELRIEQEKKAQEDAERRQREEEERIKALERQRQQQEALKKQQEEARMQLLSDVQDVVSAGKKSAVVPDGCLVVINDKATTDYQDFRNGVKLGSYSNVTVTNIESDANGVTKVYVNVKENSKDETE